MKYILGLIVILLASEMEAQMITRKNGDTGLMDTNGNELLPNSYDAITQFEQFGFNTSIYILIDDGKYGLYCSESKQLTSCKYQKIYEDQGMLLIENNNHKGYVAQPDDSSYIIIEPIYSYVSLMREGPYSGKITHLGDFSILVRNDSLWGVLSFSNGSEKLSCRFPYPISYSLYDPFWRMDYPNSYRELLINPKTGVTFESRSDYKTQYNYANNTLLIYSTIPYEGNERIPLQVNIYDYSTGLLIWNYSSSADDMKVDYISDEIVLIEESSGDKDINRKDGKKIFSFYNITNSALLLRHEGGEESRIILDLQDNKYVVYASKTYNGRQEQIGVIFR